MALMKLFLDDERMPPNVTTTDGWHVCRSYERAVELCWSIGVPDFISFDHDLGGEKTGYDFAKWFVDYILDNDIVLMTGEFDYYVHSQNPVGRDNIIAFMENFLRHNEERIKSLGNIVSNEAAFYAFRNYRQHQLDAGAIQPNEIVNLEKMWKTFGGTPCPYKNKQNRAGRILSFATEEERTAFLLKWCHK